MQNIKVLSIIILLFCACLNTSAYKDHRDPKVDSLENVLKTQNLKGVELYRVYDGLMNGYLQTDGKKSVHYAKLALKEAESLNGKNGMVYSWKIIGLNAYGACIYDSAIHCFERALKITDSMKGDDRYTEDDMDDNYSMLYGTIGNLYNIQGMVHIALDYYLKALPIFIKHGWKQSETMLYYNVGELYLELSNNDEAYNYYLKAEKTANETGDSLHIASVESGLAITLLNKEKYADALKYAKSSIAYFLNHAELERNSVLDGYVLLTNVYLGTNDIRMAEESMSKAMDYVEGCNPTNVSDAYAVRAIVFLKQNRYGDAAEWALKALDANDQDPHHNIGVYKTLAEAYSGLGKSELARKYIDLMHETMAETATAKYQTGLSEMEVRYETEMKELKIRELEQEQRLNRMYNIVFGVIIFALILAIIIGWRMARQRKHIATMQAQIDGESNERTRLGRDLHDRLGGILTALRIGVECLHCEAHEEVEKCRILDLCKGATEEMRRLAHHLMPESLSREGLVRALSDFCHSIPNARFSMLGEDRRQDERTEVMLYCAVHELVNNAVKYAEAQEITVQLMITEEYTAVIVLDDGKGFDVEAASEGMGLSNIRSRAEMLGGRFSITSSSGGTEANIEIPNK